MLPESTRWLITKKRYDEATELIQKAAKMNGKSVPEHLLVVPNDYLEVKHPTESIRSLISVKYFNRFNHFIGV